MFCSGVDVGVAVYVDVYVAVAVCESDDYVDVCCCSYVLMCWFAVDVDVVVADDVDVKMFMLM